MTTNFDKYPPVRSSRQLGSTIRRIRKSRNYSQGTLATLSGLRQAGISQMETGAEGARLGSLFKIISALDIEIVIRKRSKE